MKVLKDKTLILPLFTTLIFLISRFYGLTNVKAWEDNFSWLYRIDYYPWILETNFKGYPEEGKDLAYSGKISYHPGVTIMTFSGFSNRYLGKIVSKIEPNYSKCAYNDANCEYLYLDLFLAKLPLIILSSIALFIMLLLLIRKFGILSTLIFGTVIVSEPIFFRTSRDLHLDFLQSVFVSLAYVSYFFTKRKYRLYLSGISFGLALLTRFTSIAFILGFIFIDLIENVKISELVKKYTLLLLTTFFVFVLLYPAMWVSPVGTLKYILSGSINSTNDHLGQNTISDLKYNFSISWIWGLFLILSIYHVFNNRKTTNFMKWFQPALFFTPYLVLLFISDKIYFRYFTPVLMGYTIFISIVMSDVLSTYFKKYLNWRTKIYPDN